MGKYLSKLLVTDKMVGHLGYCNLMVHHEATLQLYAIAAYVSLQPPCQGCVIGVPRYSYFKACACVVMGFMPTGIAQMVGLLWS